MWPSLADAQLDWRSIKNWWGLALGAALSRTNIEHCLGARDIPLMFWPVKHLLLASDNDRMSNTPNFNDPDQTW